MPRNTRILDRNVVAPGTIIFHQGTTGNRAYLIERGRVEVFTKDASGHELKINEVARGSLIGEMAIISDGPRTASVRALEETVLITVSAEDLLDAMNTSNGTHRKLMRIMMERLEEKHRKVLESELQDVEKAAQKTIENLIQHIPAAQHDDFKKGAQQLLDQLRTALEKFEKK